MTMPEHLIMTRPEPGLVRVTLAPAGSLGAFLASDRGWRWCPDDGPISHTTWPSLDEALASLWDGYEIHWT